MIHNDDEKCTNDNDVMNSSGIKGIHGRLSAGPADPAGESPGFQARL